MSVPVIGVPVLNRPDLFHRFLYSIEPGAVDVVAVIDNSCGKNNNLIYLSDTEYACREPGLVTGLPIQVMTPFCNMGVGWSWNHIVKSFPDADYWLIAGSDTAFAPGDLARIDDAARSAPPDRAILHAHASNVFALLPVAVRYAGLFDENLFPAYLEDCDYHRRLDLLGLTRADIPGLGIVHGDGVLDGSCTVNSDLHYQQENVRTHGGNHEYYRKKWGGENGRELYRDPFGRPQLPPDYQAFDIDRRRAQLWRNKE